MSQILLPNSGGGGGGGTTSFVTDSGIATPAGGVIQIVTPGGGTMGLQTSAPGSSNQILVTLTASTNTVTFLTGPTTYTVLPTDFFLACDPSAGPITINFPNTTTTGRNLIVKDRTGSVTVAHPINVTTPGGVVTIDGQTTYVFTDPYESVETIFDGFNYEAF
jgi:hypothetical protein